MDKKIFVFDVDGTLANITHRQVFLRSKPKNWPAFNKNMHLDNPHTDIIWLAKTFSELGHTIVICSGRGSENRQITIDWLNKHSVPFNALYMRELGDYRADNIVKLELLEKIREDFGNPFMVFDDRNSVCQMWRENGVRCLQVAPGDF